MLLKYPAAIILTILSLLFILVNCAPQKDNLGRKPNVLFIAVDDLSDWLGCLGGHPNAKIPKMYRLASKEVLFTNAHSQAPLCGLYEF